jgi:hypothetical protein
MKTNLYGDSYNRIPIGQISLHTLIDLKYHIITANEFRDGSLLVNNTNNILNLTPVNGYSSNNEGILGDENVNITVEKDPFNEDKINLVIDFIDSITNATLDIYDIKQIEK